MIYRFFKRLFDFLASLILLIALCWLYLIIALLVAAKLGRPVIFKQQRPGKDGKIFTLFKYRSMTDERGDDGELLPDEQRLTSFGDRLRSLSLDELPELVNILKGDMSFVGPRPLLIRYLPRYSSEQARRHEVKPGLTGLAQINGRNALSWPEKFAYDVYYADHISPSLDLKILAKTFLAVLKREGISETGEATMSEFTGEE